MSKTGTKSKQSTESAGLSANGPQPVWMTLNEARERAFTGEIIFEVDPEVLAYLDNGVVYYAERAADASLGRRLLDAGVIDASQLERGTVRVGDVEHLGRLFDRDPSVDRDSVLVLAETATEELITELANEAITTIRVTAYRHHPSGVHRWFVAPAEPTANQRPISEVAPLDTTVVDDLPGLPVASASLSADELTIEWEESLDGFEELEPLPTIDELDASMLEAMLDGGTDLEMEFVADVPEDELDDWDQSVEALLDFTTEPDADDVVQIDPEYFTEIEESGLEIAVEDPAQDGDAVAVVEYFDEVPDVEEIAEVEVLEAEVLEVEVAEVEVVEVEVVEVEVAEVEDELWIDVHDDFVLTEEAVIEEVLIEEVVIEVEVVEEAVIEEAVLEDTVVEDAGPDWDLGTDDIVDLEFQVVWPDDTDDIGADLSADEGDAVTEIDEGAASGDDGWLDQEEPDAAPIVQATDDGLYFEMPQLTLSDEPASDEEVPDDVADAVRRAIAAIESAAVDTPSIAPISDPGPGDVDAPAAPAHSGLSAFAPPSPATSAEVLYGQWEAAAAEAASGSVSDEASVEFDADESTEGVEDAASERSSALRRLIGSLRRKGH